MARGFNTRSRGSFRGFRGGNSFRGRGRGGSHGAKTDAAPKQDDEGTRLAERFEQVKVYDDIDSKLGFSRIQEGTKKEGWLVNMHPVECNFSIQTHGADISIETKSLKSPYHVLTRLLC